MFNINRLDGISAVEDLTDAAAAVLEGGDGFVGGDLNFDFSISTRGFSVPRGGFVNFDTSTKEGRSSIGTFTAALKNLGTGRTSTKTVSVGLNGKTSWSNVRGGNYVIKLRDRRDGSFITGTYGITHPLR